MENDIGHVPPLTPGGSVPAGPVEGPEQTRQFLLLPGQRTDDGVHDDRA
jgi:hypothetical protein